MKKLISFSICFLLIFTLIGCSRETGHETTNEETKTTENSTNENKNSNNTSNNKEEEKTTDENKTSDNTSQTTTPSTQKIICIDAGHQAKGNNEKEPNGPGSKTMKKKVSYGTSGVATKKAESQLNLEIALKLQTELTKRGYKVVMVRTTQNVNISNVERAQIANKANADANIRIHADGSTNRSVHGFSILTASTKNKYLSSDIISKSYKLSNSIMKTYASATGIKNNGISYRDDLTGTNWSKVPTTLVEMGYMSNADEDRNLSKESTQANIVKGIADGIDNYFAS